MITFESYHQPFLFRESGKVKILTSKFLDGYYIIDFGMSMASEHYWKLNIIDYDSKEAMVVDTPNIFFIDGRDHNVVAECNGYIYRIPNNGLRLSYIVSVHSGLSDTPLKFYFVDCDFDPISFKTSNHNLIKDIRFHRTGIKDNDNIIAIHDDKILINDVEEVDMSSDFDQIVRLMGVWDQPDDFLISGTYKKFHKTVLYNIKEKTKNTIVCGDNQNIYKSSLLKMDNYYLLAWTDKVFRNAGESDYFLRVSKIDHI